MDKTQFIHQQIQLSKQSINATLQLFSEDCTIPFIARYRKDKTGNLDEVQIELISKFSKSFDEIVKRKASVIKSIEEQDLMTSELLMKLENAFDLQLIEDLYLPFKKKKNTKAEVARSLGLEPLAKIIMSQNPNDLLFTASKYVKGKIESEEEALQGARDIIAEWLNENLFIR